MGITLRVNIVDIVEFKEAVAAVGCYDGPELEHILRKCGSCCGENYVVLDNERAGDDNPFEVLLRLLADRFPNGKDREQREYEILKAAYKATWIEGITHANYGDA